MANRKKGARKLANELIMVSLVMVGLLLVWNASQRISHFNSWQQELAEHSVKAAASEVELVIRGYQRAVRIFAEENNMFLNAVEKWPQDMENYARLQEKVNRYFPEQYTFTLADNSGNTLLAGLEGLVGKRCREDIRKFSANDGAHDTYRHQSPAGKQSHFDIMSYWQGSDSDKSVFFISLTMQRLERVLGNTQVPGHLLMLLRQDMPEQIDVTVPENRALLPEDGLLDAGEQRRISHSLPVPGTRWNMAILPDKTLYSEAHRSILIQALFLFAGFMIVSILMRMILLDEDG